MSRRHQVKRMILNWTEHMLTEQMQNKMRQWMSFLADALHQVEQVQAMDVLVPCCTHIYVRDCLSVHLLPGGLSHLLCGPTCRRRTLVVWTALRITRLVTCEAMLVAATFVRMSHHTCKYSSELKDA
jgi:hypothetical protein